MTLGVVLGYSSVIGMAGIVLFLLPGLAYRMNVEERLLAEQFGEEYSDYVRRSKRLIPGIW
jgi:protein-S-isoprenylcysteine O-methyltransferase Ste14